MIMMSENDLLPENNGKVSVNEENVFVQKFENSFILENNELVQHVFQ